MDRIVVGYTYEDGYCLCADCGADAGVNSGAILAWHEGVARCYCDKCGDRLGEPCVAPASIFDAETLEPVADLEGALKFAKRKRGK